MDNIIIICHTWIGNDSVNYTKLYITEKQSLLIRLRESPPMFIVKFFKCLCRQLVIMGIHIVFSLCDSDRIVLLLKQYYYLLLIANIEIKIM